MLRADESGLRRPAIGLAVVGLLIVILAFFIGNDECAIRISGDCLGPDARLFVFVLGMFVLTWAAIFLAAHRIVSHLRG